MSRGFLCCSFPTLRLGKSHTNPSSAADCLLVPDTRFCVIQAALLGTCHRQYQASQGSDWLIRPREFSYAKQEARSVPAKGSCIQLERGDSDIPECGWTPPATQPPPTSLSHHPRAMAISGTNVEGRGRPTDESKAAKHVMRPHNATESKFKVNSPDPKGANLWLLFALCFPPELPEAKKLVRRVDLGGPKFTRCQKYRRLMFRDFLSSLSRGILLATSR